MNQLKALALLIFILFYSSYLSKQLALKRQGIASDRLGRGSKPKRTLIIERALKTATFSMAVVQLISVFLDEQWSLLNRIGTMQYIGLGISFTGALVFIAAMITMNTSWRAGVDTSQHTKLVRRGIYRISRNPAFLGFDLFYLGFALTFSNPLQLLFTLLCILLLHLQILEEEKFLPTVFGEDYQSYKKSVGRYFILL